MKYLALFALLLSFFLGSHAQSSLDSLLSVPGGAYQDAQVIEVDTTGGYSVYYSSDGSKPSHYSKKYKSGISVESPTVMRFTFYKGGVPVESFHQSYIIGRTFNMAVISISVKDDDMFGFTRGIYVKGCCADTVTPYHGANFWKGWERPVNIEMFEPDNTHCFNQGAGIRIFGGFSKGLAMKSLAIIAKKKYGSKKFKYQIFPNKDIKKFNSFILRNSGGDFNNTHFRDALITDLSEPLDLDIQAYRPAVVYINGTYWGIHNIREKLNEHYLSDNHDVDKDSVDLMKHRNDLQVGDKKEYQKLLKYLGKNSFETNEMIQELDTKMDIDNYINYNIAEIYSDNGDAGGNIRYWREKKDGARWRWILFDLDLSMNIGSKTAYKENTLEQMTRLSNEKWPNPAWATFIIRKLLENDSIKNLYINKFGDHLNTIYSEDMVNFKIDSIYNLIADEMPYHIKKWPTSIEKWNIRVDRLRSFATYRPFYLRSYIIEKFALEDTLLLTIPEYSYEMGSVKLNTLDIEKPFSGWYFGGCPVHITATPKDGYELVSWEGYESSELEIWVDLTSPTAIFPIFQRKEDSPSTKFIKINEVSIYQDSSSLSEDWIELHNTSGDQQDLSGWHITTSDDEEFTFPEGSTIGAHGYLVLSRDIELFQGVYNISNDLLVSTDMGFGFSKKEDFIQLFDTSFQFVDSLRYNIKNDFEVLKDVDSKNLERENPKTDVWKVSTQATPGSQNAGFKGLPVKSDDSNKNGLWMFVIILGLFGLTGAVILIYLKKKKNSIAKSSLEITE